ncbi:hypothetical protein [Mucilaginibacter sp. L196]|uniref:hypothetical protein n=1 Tax=Mucilaginibacter sp. L196 TaxID=1641870 RepID=UPI00131AF4BD|nr:hypothetical protein [Mucilaginibacter sp. L196]
MKNALYFIITCLVSTGALIGALNGKNPFPAFGVAFGIWAIFVWGYNRRSKRKAEMRYRGKPFEDYRRAKLRNNQRN